MLRKDLFYYRPSKVTSGDDGDVLQDLLKLCYENQRAKRNMQNYLECIAKTLRGERTPSA